MPPAADDTRRCLIVGAGRAGSSFASALAEVGWSVDLVSSRDLDRIPLEAIEHSDVVLLTVADAAIADVASQVAAALDHPVSGVVAHVSGSCDLDVLRPHPRTASIHPLMSLPDAATGARRLLDTCTFAVDGDPSIVDIVDDLGGRAIEVPSEKRAIYHATASVAANHLTALCAQVERLAAHADVPAEAFWPLMATTLANVADAGAAASLTGPAARGDWSTVRAHLAALPDDERQLYRVLCARAADLAGRSLPGDLRAT